MLAGKELNMHKQLSSGSENYSIKLFAYIIFVINLF